MAQYRRLSLSELENLNEEFIKFLLVQNLTLIDWEKIKKEDTTQTNQLIDTFSDLVFDKILTDTQFALKVNDKRVEAYQFYAEEMLLIALQAKPNSAIDFNKNTLSEINFSELEVFKGKKKYQKHRNEEVFELLQKGAAKSDGKYFKQLALLLADY
jgi:hypothetical protein